VSVTPLVGRPLDPHERQYLALVGRHLRDVDRATRADVLRAANDHLTDRPRTPDEDALRRELGSPREYAVSLRAAHGLGPERTDWWARWIAISRARRWAGVLVVLLLVVGTITGVATYRSWSDWKAGIHNNGFGATWVDESDPLDGITDVRTMRDIEVTVPFRAGEVVQVAALLSSERAVTVDEIVIDTAPTLNFEFVGVETRPMNGTIWEPFTPFRLDRDGDPGAAARWVRVLLRFTDCAGFAGGGGPVLDRLEVRYHARGRDRAEVVPLIGSVVLAC
jgi:hypothetical protein